jgi:hypothetical protein
MTQVKLMTRLREGADADRVLHALVSGVYDGVTAREIAHDLRLPADYVREQMAAIAAEQAATCDAADLATLQRYGLKSLVSLLECAEVMRIRERTDGYNGSGDAIDFLTHLIVQDGYRMAMEPPV